MVCLKPWLGAAAMVLSTAAAAQAYPAKPIVFLSPAPGGALEAVQRAILDKVRENTGAVLVFEPKPGGGGAVALQALKAAVPDGHTFAIPWAGALTLGPLIHRAQKIDPVRDFVPVTTLYSLAVVLAARQDFPARDIRDLVAMAKARPDALRVGVFGSGNRAWMAMLAERSGAKFMLVPYKNSSEQLAATLGGHQDLHFETVGTLLAQQGRLKALAYGGRTASPLLPGVPVVRDLYQFDMQSWFGVVAPAGTPPAAVDWVAREVNKALKDPKITQLILANGYTPEGGTPQEFARLIRAELDENAALVRQHPDIQ